MDSRHPTYIFFLQVLQIVAAFVHTVRITGNHDDVRVRIFLPWETDIDLVLIHDTVDSLATSADQTTMDAMIDCQLNRDLVLLMV